MFDSYLITSLSKLNKNSKIEIIRFELYSCYSSLLLSREYFKRNIEIKEFLSKSNVNFKAYVYLSRTQVISRIIRVIEKAEKETLLLLLEQIKLVVFEKVYSYKENNSDQPKVENYIDSLMEQFGRGE